MDATMAAHNFLFSKKFQKFPPELAKIVTRSKIFDYFFAKSSFRSTLMPRWRPTIFNFPKKFKKFPQKAPLVAKIDTKDDIFRPKTPP